jgi:hypothetical protein
MPREPGPPHLLRPFDAPLAADADARGDLFDLGLLIYHGPPKLDMPKTKLLIQPLALPSCLMQWMLIPFLHLLPLIVL